MAKRQSPPLTENEIKSVFRNEFYTIDDPEYYEHRAINGKKHRNCKYAEETVERLVDKLQKTL